jgi:hypothetical protein
MQENTASVYHADEAGIRCSERLDFLLINKQRQIPLPPRGSKLWSAVRMRDRDDIVGVFSD